MTARVIGTLPTVDEVETRVLRIPTDAPEADGTAAWDSTTLVVVLLRAGGTTGLGYTYSSAAAAVVIDEELAPALRGRSLTDLGAVVADLEHALRNPGRPGIGACALSAVDVALWDARARALGVPLADLLGRVRASAPVYGSGGFTTYDDERLHDQLAGWARDGCRWVKLKIGESWGTRVERDLHRVGIARAAVGPGVGVFVDANGAYGVAQALRVDRAMRAFDVTWFEEPVSSDYPDQLAAVRAGATADIAAGEYVYRPSDAVALLGSVDCLQLDVTRCGGYSGWLQLSALAAAHGVPVSAHCAPQLAAHAGCATRGFRHLEYFHDHARLEKQVFAGTLPLVGGALTPDRRPGHGLSLRDSATV
ncbi:enolase C-terminal domain-like protein [uncultured Leifsonia sp.]|uniref:enolase C-terminal domain-like protein n=1 Tax=uncultured Leifsonia sp. TaxID=340359 RepID=UPI0025FE6F23|nr:enolase C-terminal domain-like protein [uncultured Leifsonia sp.]